jgi:lysophospholipase L1-like esterase
VTTAQPPAADGLLDGEDAASHVDLAGEDDGGRKIERGTFRKIGAAMATVTLAIVASYVIEPLHFARPWTRPDAPVRLLRGERADPVPFWNVIGRELMGEGAAQVAVAEEAAQTEALAAEVLREDQTQVAPIEDRVVIAPPTDDRLPPYQARPEDAEVAKQPIELPSPTALDGFYDRLARSDAGYRGAITRVVHWGDSVVAADHITSAVRAKMQQRFGDAGHGFILLAKPNSSYIKKAIEFRDGEDWSRCYIINKCKSDGLYGLGGTTVWNSGGAQTRYATSDSTPNGRKASMIELWYRAEPKAGNVRVRIDKGEPITVATSAEVEADAWHRIDVEDGAHEFEVRAAGGGKVRLYGVVIERDVPGVVWDGMAQLGAFTSRMLYFDPDHIRDQIAHRDAALLVFMFGGNDLLLPEHRLDEYREDFRAMLKRFRAQAKPPACLVMSPVDHGVRTSQRVESNAMVPKITQIQREVAMEEGCGFFDTLAAMGGDGSVARWRKASPPLISGDLAHLTDAGQKVLGHLLFTAIVQGYVDYRAREAAGTTTPAK